MRRDATLIALITCAALAQTPPPLHIEGVVVDTNGKPVADARIDHTSNSLAYYRTDGNGRFSISTRAEVIIVRKLGFQSQLLRFTGATHLRVTLQLSKEGQSLSLCKNRSARPVALTIQFERIPSEVEIGPDVSDFDYTGRDYRLQTSQGTRALAVGQGHSWSWGGPSDSDVWKSVEYSERVYGDGQQITFIDARGKYANGNRWRSLSAWGESASYHDADEPAAKIFDQMLDSACTY